MSLRDLYFRGRVGFAIDRRFLNHHGCFISMAFGSVPTLVDRDLNLGISSPHFTSEGSALDFIFLL